MDEEADADEACAGVCGECEVEEDCGPGVEWVVADGAAVGDVDGVGEQVVEVDRHGGEHDEPGAFPWGLPGSGRAEPGGEPGDDEVEEDVEDGAEHNVIWGDRWGGVFS